MTDRRWTALAATALSAVLVTLGTLGAVGPAAADTVGGPQLGSPGVVLHARAGATPIPPAADAATWLLADLTTGEVLAAKGAHVPMFPASTLKTLTAVTLMPVLDPATVVTVSHDQAAAPGSRVGLQAGATYTVWDLWHGLLLPSGNDAAAALAGANGGMAKTVAEMADKARELGARDTVVRNDSGYDDPRQRTSAYDMALFARAALAIPQFDTITRTKNYDFPGKMPAAGKPRATYKIYSQDRLLLHGFRGTIGGKTGFTTMAKRTFWAAAQRDGHTLLVTMFRITGHTEAAAKALLDWGFANRTKLIPVGTLVTPAAAAVSSTSGTGSGTTGANAPTQALGAASTTAGARIPSRVGAALATALVMLAVAGGWLLWRRRRVAPAAAATAAPAPTAAATPTARDEAAPPSPVPAGPVPAGPVPAGPVPGPTPSSGVRVLPPGWVRPDGPQAGAGGPAQAGDAGTNPSRS